MYPGQTAPGPDPIPLPQRLEPSRPGPDRMEKNFGGGVQNKMYPGQTDSGPGATTAEASSAHQSAPPLLSAEAAANIRAEAALNPVRTGQGPQNEEKRTLEGESRTNVPRTDPLPRHTPLKAPADKADWAADFL